MRNAQAGREIGLHRQLACACRLHCARVILAAAVAALPGVSAGQAQDYPSKSIRVVIPYAPGGATDTPGRIVVTKLSENSRFQTVIDNRPGAGGTVGAGIVARAAPDGYTLLITSTTHVIAGQLYKNLGYHPVNDFVAVMQFGVSPNVLVVHPSVPARSVQELVALAKSRPGELDYASSGIGTTQHMLAELFQYLSGTRMRHIPYQGGRPEIDVVSGRVQIWFVGVARAIPHIKAGQVRALATTGDKRPQALPDLPTIAEAGVKGYAGESWHVMLAPKGTPARITNALQSELSKVMALPDVAKRFNGTGNEVLTAPGSQVEAMLRADYDKWGKVIKASGQKGE
jgi:tripartite-type tricarboxylate transporter receptor subunit TctC